MSERKYIASIDFGQGGEAILCADSMDEAFSDAVDWAIDGDWNHALEEFGSFEVYVRVEDTEDPDLNYGEFLTIGLGE